MDKKTLLSQAIDASNAVTAVTIALRKARTLATDQHNEYWDITGDTREEITVEDRSSLVYYFPAAKQRGLMMIDYLHAMQAPLAELESKVDAIVEALKEEEEEKTNAH